MELLKYKKKDNELIVWLENEPRKSYPIDKVEEWAEEQDVLLRSHAETFDYDGTYQEHKLNFTDWYLHDMYPEDVEEFLEWTEK